MDRLCMAACNHLGKPGPGGSSRGATAPPVRSHPSRVGSWPPSRGWFLGRPRSSPHRCLTQNWPLDGLFHLFLLRISVLCFLLYAFCLVLFIFHFYSNVCHAKRVFSNTSGTRSIVFAYVSKVCLILLFWTLFGGQIRSIVTANKSPKLNLCSPRANS